MTEPRTAGDRATPVEPDDEDYLKWAKPWKAMEAELVTLREAQRETVKKAHLIDAVLSEYADELAEGACNQCEQCGPLVMCAFHSLLSVLSGRTWTNAAIELDAMREAHARLEAERDALHKLACDRAKEIAELEHREDTAEAALRTVVSEMRGYAQLIEEGQVVEASAARLLGWADQLETK